MLMAGDWLLMASTRVHCMNTNKYLVNSTAMMIYKFRTVRGQPVHWIILG